MEPQDASAPRDIQVGSNSGISIRDYKHCHMCRLAKKQKKKYRKLPAKKAEEVIWIRVTSERSFLSFLGYEFIPILPHENWAVPLEKSKTL